MSLANVLIDAYHTLVDDKDALTLELGEVEQTRDDLVVCVVDLKESISNLENEKVVLTEKIASVEHERDDLLVVIIDLKETIEELGAEYRPGNSKKGKVIASEAHIKLEKELTVVRTNLCVELQLQVELERVKNDLEKSLKWTWSSEAITAIYVNNGGNRYKNIYVADFESLQSGDLSCLKVVDDEAELWHRRLGHTSFSLLNKLIQKDMVRGLPMSKFKEHKVCDACAIGKYVKSSFKSKKDVSTSKPLDLLHMDLCGPMRVQNRGGKGYIFVIVDDYSRFIWTLFLRTKDETFKVFVAFVRKIQVKMESRVACIRSNHGTEFDNAKFDEFCTKNGITHNFSALRTPCEHVIFALRKTAPK
ncbi:uncharacterized protein [Nicotiana sylvestris]|uniref:uncharacterized protein n=1 Tax=Nicotiana sylvestris TaxID=4096 RepID=UPI00388C4734